MAESMDRREFLKVSGGASAGALLANFKTEAGGHGGTDTLELALFVEAVRKKSQTPIDVYDSVLMSSIIPLSEKSIAAGSTPIECPDFTRGKWKTKKPAFGVEG
ncbi:MAG: twin-arginine translocation signal domain-containing protein [Candidatus Aminicenantes bacterium]|nr:twin-arginine translocation signal domain-containing protein [Candidatus Aminicenantes bacterium]